MMRALLGLTLTVTVFCVACGDSGAGLPAADGTAEPGSPLPGLTADQLARFERGRVWFNYGFTPEEGLGPLYIQDRCSSCHDLPTIGGYGSERLAKENRWDAATEQCDALDAQGGEIVQTQITPAYRVAGGEPERVPLGATHFVNFVPFQTFGVGLIGAIPEEEIVRRADPDDSDGDGISGRVVHDPQGRLGRFGRRATAPDLTEFVAGGLLVELGLTTPEFPNENQPNGEPLPEGVDQAPDPEINDSTVAEFVDFVRFLALPAREAATGAAADSIEQGEREFFRAGCAQCHVPTMQTGPNEVAALDRKTVPLWSDLLLHDLGPEVESVCAGPVGPSEFRTTPLAGLRLRQPYMHNGKALDIEASIGMHGGEAAGSRAAWSLLDESGKAMLLRFLRSL
jgi:CxxC motif-containing protein (DUF1111 family)